MLNTKNGIAPETREYIVGTLQYRLSESLDLMQQYKNAHWNISGTGFLAVHRALDEFQKEISETLDKIAERMLQLGGEAKGTWQSIAKFSRLPPYPTEALNMQIHLDFLSSSIFKYSEGLRHDIFDPILGKDPVTKDILIQACALAEKHLWLIEASGMKAEFSLEKIA